MLGRERREANALPGVIRNCRPVVPPGPATEAERAAIGVVARLPRDARTGRFVVDGVVVDPASTAIPIPIAAKNARDRATNARTSTSYSAPPGVRWLRLRSSS